MALTKDKKSQIVDEASKLLASSKLTVMAKYEGTPVKSLQELRRSAKDNGTKVVVIKNRLFKLALSQDDRFKDIDSNNLTGQLLYAFNEQDEIAPAQSIANFAKTQTQVEFVGALDADGNFISAEDVKALAALPSKDQLRAQLVGTIAAPLTGFANVLAGNVRSVLNVLNARSEQIS